MNIEPEFALAVLIALCGALGSFFAVKFGQAETQRLVKALHGRFDELERDVREIRETQARHDERIKALRQSQQFKLNRRLAAIDGPQDMFPEADAE